MTAGTAPVIGQDMPSNSNAIGIKAPVNTWAGDVQNYEYMKRHSIHPDVLKAPPIVMTNGLVKQQERMFDPVLQRFRDQEFEFDSRLREEEARVAHLNRAMDVQLLREQPHNIINNASRLEGICPEVDPCKFFPKGMKAGKPKVPPTFQDFNILSNLPLSQHHWAPPECRPLPTIKEPKRRQIPTFLVKDFNIITNRYLEKHHDKRIRDDELNLLECTSKYRIRNRFDPLLQKFNDPDEEDWLKAWNEAYEAGRVENAHQKICPSIKNRVSAFYNPVNHEENDKDMLNWLDLSEEERRERYKNRYIVEHNQHIQDVKADHINEERKLNKVNLTRFVGPLERGYGIVNNVSFNGLEGQHPYLPYSRPLPSVWERVCNNTMGPNQRATSLPPGRTHSEISSEINSPNRNVHRPNSDGGRQQPTELMISTHDTNMMKQENKQGRIIPTPPPIDTSSNYSSNYSHVGVIDRRGGPPSIISSTHPEPHYMDGAEVLRVQQDRVKGGKKDKGYIGPPRQYGAPRDGEDALSTMTSDQSMQSTQNSIRKKVTVQSVRGSDVITSSRPRVPSDAGSDLRPPPGVHAKHHARYAMPALRMRPGTPGQMISPPIAPPLPPSLSDHGSVYSKPISMTG